MNIPDQKRINDMIIAGYESFIILSNNEIIYLTERELADFGYGDGCLSVIDKGLKQEIHETFKEMRVPKTQTGIPLSYDDQILQKQPLVEVGYSEILFKLPSGSWLGWFRLKSLLKLPYQQTSYKINPSILKQTEPTKPD